MISNDLPHPRELNLDYPDWRDGQIKGLGWLQKDEWLESETLQEDVVSQGRRIKVIEAPTGTGKTGLILALAKLNPELRFLVMCATKIEQEQYIKNLINKLEGDVVSVKGKNNFHCVLKHGHMSVEASECKEDWCTMTHVDEAPCEGFQRMSLPNSADEGESESEEDKEVRQQVEAESKQPRFKCPVRGSCTYYSQLGTARTAQVPITNYAYGLSVLNYTEEGFGQIDVIVEDEGHVLDEQLENFISLKLSGRAVDDLFDISLPRFRDEDGVEGGEVSDWKGWVIENKRYLERARRKYIGLNPDSMSVKELKDKIRTYRYLGLFERILSMDYSWVVEQGQSGPEFKPVWVTQDSKGVLFDHALRHVIMSGTIPSSQELAAKVGLGVDEFRFFRLPYTFPPENRPIIVRPKVSLKRDHLSANLSVLVNVVDEVIDEFRGYQKKVLIHSKTYKIAEYLIENSDYAQYMMTHTSRTRGAMLEAFKRSSAPAIMVSPSFDKAVDLPGDECELIIIAKVPYPYLGSKVMAKRAKESRRYYTHETLMTLIQMAGRGVRSDVDVCPTVIVDKLGPTFIAQAMKMIPVGIKEALVLEV